MISHTCTFAFVYSKKCPLIVGQYYIISVCYTFFMESTKKGTYSKNKYIVVQLD